MYTGTVPRNDDGSYSSSAGHSVTKGPDGQLYSGGAPIGLSAGSGGGVAATGWDTGSVPSGFGNPLRNVGAAQSAQGYMSHGSGPQPLPSLLSLPVYLWMAMLAVVAGLMVSAPESIIDEGLRWHPAYGVGVAVTVIFAYRYLMSWFPTALVVAVTSTFAWALSGLSQRRKFLRA